MRPGTFARLLLLEPIIVHPLSEVASYLVDLALKRRNAFASLSEVREYYTTKKGDFFNRWDKRVLNAYIADGFLFDSKSVVWRMKCTPLTESKTYPGCFNTGM